MSRHALSILGKRGSTYYNYIYHPCRTGMFYLPVFSWLTFDFDTRMNSFLIRSNDRSHHFMDSVVVVDDIHRYLGKHGGLVRYPTFQMHLEHYVRQEDEECITQNQKKECADRFDAWKIAYIQLTPL